MQFISVDLVACAWSQRVKLGHDYLSIATSLRCKNPADLINNTLQLSPKYDVSWPPSGDGRVILNLLSFQLDDLHLESLMAGYYNRYKIPGCIGLVDIKVIALSCKDPNLRIMDSNLLKGVKVTYLHYY